MFEGWRLGNDVVDLTSPRCRGKAENSRFTQRVLHPAEQETLATSSAPDRALWILWAGKEAIFKSATKALGSPPIFHHPEFRVAFSPEVLRDPFGTKKGEDPDGSIRGSGSYRHLSFGLRVYGTPGYIHALSWVESPGRNLPDVVREVSQEGGDGRELRSQFSPEEWACVSHEDSARTRLAARRALARALEIAEGRLEIRCGPGEPGRRVPLTFLDQAPIPVDLTLSHDGPLMAWAFIP